jgi:hypothetical protein
LTPSLFLGVGFIAEEGQTTEIAGVGTFRTGRSNSPAVSYGAGLAYGLSNRTALRAEARAVTSFMGSMSIEGPGGQSFPVEGGETTTVLVTAGLDLRF